MRTDIWTSFSSLRTLLIGTLHQLCEWAVFIKTYNMSYTVIYRINKTSRAILLCYCVLQPLQSWGYLLGKKKSSLIHTSEAKQKSSLLTLLLTWLDTALTRNNCEWLMLWLQDLQPLIRCGRNLKIVEPGREILRLLSLGRGPGQQSPKFYTTKQC